jgi:hypothetical protein
MRLTTCRKKRVRSQKPIAIRGLSLVGNGNPINSQHRFRLPDQHIRRDSKSGVQAANHWQGERPLMIHHFRDAGTAVDVRLQIAAAQSPLIDDPVLGASAYYLYALPRDLAH